MSFYRPDIYFFLSEENEDDTKDDIDSMGMKLAREIKGFIDYYVESEHF